MEAMETEQTQEKVKEQQLKRLEKKMKLFSQTEDVAACLRQSQTQKRIQETEEQEAITLIQCRESVIEAEDLAEVES